MNTDPSMSLPDEFPPHPEGFCEPVPTDVQKLLSRVAAERPIDGKDNTHDTGELETYHAMYTLSYDVEDPVEILMTQWGRRIGFMLAGVSFRKSERIHWNFDRDDPSAEAYHVAIQAALEAFEKIPGNTELLEEIIHFASPAEFYRIVLRNMIGLSLAEIGHWRERTTLKKMGKCIVAYIEGEKSDATAEPSPEIVPVGSMDRYKAEDLVQLLDEIIDPDTGETIPANEEWCKEEEQVRAPWKVSYTSEDLVHLPLDDIMNENGEVLSAGVEDEQNPYYMALVRIAAMTRKMADEEYDSFGSFKDFCGTIAHQLSDKDSNAARRIVHNARFASFIVAGINYSKRHWQVRQHAIDDKIYLGHELTDAADAAVDYVQGEKLLANRLEVFLPFIASNEEDILLARRVACLTLAQIAKWRLYQMLEQDGLRD